VLDLGCGTAVLAMAAAHLWDGAVLAADNDPAAVAVARAGVAANGLRGRIRVLRSDGYRAAALRTGAPYDLVIANILAGPLIALAGGLARHTHAGSVAILAGLLRPQERAVIAAHEQAGFRVVDRRLEGDWPILVLEKRRTGGPRRAGRTGPRSPAPKRKRRLQGKSRRSVR
jgi:ribosomal protein L11 methyltransferase